MPKAGIQFQKRDEYMTPKEVWDFFGPFDYDPATTLEQAEKMDVPSCDNIETDGLETDWTEYRKIWINPPFTRKVEFLLKAVQSLELMENEDRIFFLMPIEFATTKIFHEIMGGQGYIMYIPNGRIKFDDGSGRTSSPAFGSVILEMGPTFTKKEIKHWRLYDKST